MHVFGTNKTIYILNLIYLQVEFTFIAILSNYYRWIFLRYILALALWCENDLFYVQIM